MFILLISEEHVRHDNLVWQNITKGIGSVNEPIFLHSIQYPYLKTLVILAVFEVIHCLMQFYSDSFVFGVKSTTFASLRCYVIGYLAPINTESARSFAIVIVVIGTGLIRILSYAHYLSWTVKFADRFMEKLR
jgi:hypothetical protein